MLLIVGAGGVGRAFAYRLYEVGEKVGILHRPYQVIEAPFPCWTDASHVPFSAVRGVLLCIKDRQIPEVASQLQPLLPKDSIVLHTAGSVPLSVLSTLYGEQSGVLYPLYSFIVGEKIPWGSFPIFWEGHPQVYEWALLLAGKAEQVQKASSEERLRLHIGAVFTANFLNALFHIGGQLAAPVGSWRTFLPLAEGILQRLKVRSPAEAQTGPARRGDIPTLQTHIDYLQNNAPHLLPIYKELTEYIQQHITF